MRAQNAASMRRSLMGAQAYDALRTAIVSGSYPAETRLKEADLASDLGMSRTPIREAIRQLELDGLVSITPNAGAVVREMTAQDVEEIFALRAVLEGFSASEAAQRMNDAEIAALAVNQSDLQNCSSRGTDANVDRLMTLNGEFHRALIRGSQNTRLMALHDKVTELPLLWRTRFWGSPPARESAVMYHGEVVEAIHARDPLRADAVMKSHLYAAKDFFAAQSEGGSTGPPRSNKN